MSSNLILSSGAIRAEEGSQLAGFEWPDDTENTLLLGCLWSPDQAVIVPSATVYGDQPALVDLSPDKALFERWRVADHARANPLMYGSELMVCLAVETMLGVPGSKQILARQLATLNSLFKYGTPPYNGYILRWDPVTSDHWVTATGEGGIVVTSCCDFLTDSGCPDGYAYCTPLDDPRYVPYMQQSAFNTLSPADQLTYQTARIKCLDMTRYWEPSLDEITGLIAGYSFVYQVVADPDIRAQVTDQVTRLAGYLSANAYYLVRPGGGFASQGSQAMAPAAEYPYGRVFSRIIGSDFASQTGFEGVLQNARLWPEFSEAFALASLALPAAVLLAFLLSYLLAFVPVLGFLLAGIITAVGGILTFIGLVSGDAIPKALVLLLNQELFDVRAWPGPAPGGEPAHNSEQSAFALAYLVQQLPAQVRFTATMSSMAVGIGKYDQNFPPFIALSALNDTDQTVRDNYLIWLYAQRATGSEGANTDAFASAIALLLGGLPDEQEVLTGLIARMAANYDRSWDPVGNAGNGPAGSGNAGNSDAAAIVDVQVDFPCDPAINHYPAETTYTVPGLSFQGLDVTTPPTTLDFMAALALAWYYSQTQASAGNPVPPSSGFPAAPRNGTVLPAATIPASVIQASYFETPAQIIPIQEALPPLTDPLPAETDLFAPNAPAKPAHPPAPLPPVRWLYSAVQDHYGNPGGDSGTETVNAGMSLTGFGCTIIGVKLELVNSQGQPLGDIGTTTTNFTQLVANTGRPDAVTGVWPFTSGVRIVSGGSTPTDETVTVHWWYSTFRACRYRVGYLVQGDSCSL